MIGRLRYDRHLPARPPEAGIYPVTHVPGGHIAAIPSDGRDWWEGPMRHDPDRAKRDLHAELDLRRWLHEWASRRGDDHTGALG